MIGGKGERGVADRRPGTRWRWRFRYKGLGEMGAPQRLAAGFRGVRYQVADVARSVVFYTERLGFTLEHQQLPAFARVSLGPLQLVGV